MEISTFINAPRRIQTFLIESPRIFKKRKVALIDETACPRSGTPLDSAGISYRGFASRLNVRALLK